MLTRRLTRPLRDPYASAKLNKSTLTRHPYATLTQPLRDPYATLKKQTLARSLRDPYASARFAYADHFTLRATQRIAYANPYAHHAF